MIPRTFRGASSIPLFLLTFLGRRSEFVFLIAVEKSQLRAVFDSVFSDGQQLAFCGLVVLYYGFGEVARADDLIGLCARKSTGC